LRKDEAMELISNYEETLSNIYDEATSSNPDMDKIAGMVAQVIDVGEDEEG
jgi:hypothetical protein